MASADSGSWVAASGRRSAARALLWLYGSDALFRSSADFAMIGLVVYLFVAPLPLPRLEWPIAASPATSGHVGTGAGAASNGAVAGSPPSSPASQLNGKDLAAAANPDIAKKRIKVRRDWFKLSDPAMLAQLNRAADQIDAVTPAAALATLQEIGRPDDPNVNNLSAIAILESRDKDSMQRAYAAHLHAAQAGQPDSMNEVGQFLRIGAAGHVDLPTAVDWYEKGAAAGSAAAATNAGRAYYLAWARPQDYAKAARYYRMGAEGGDPWGMHNYGAALINAQGVAADAAAGRSWVEKAAEAGIPDAQYSLGKLWRKGIGGPQDVDVFVTWSQKAADRGFAPALYDLGMFFLSPDDSRASDPTRAALYLKQAALKKYAPAQYAYATLCERGAGVPANRVQAFLYYSLALRGGAAAAQSRLDGLRGQMSAKEIEAAQQLVAVAGS